MQERRYELVEAGALAMEKYNTVVPMPGQSKDAPAAPDPRDRERFDGLVTECRRQHGVCLRAAAELRLWRGWVWALRGALVVVTFSLLASAAYRAAMLVPDLKAHQGIVVALIGGLAVAAVVRWIDTNSGTPDPAAAGFVNLADRFLLAANVRFDDTFLVFSARFEALMLRLDAARAAAPPVPDWVAQLAWSMARNAEDARPLNF